ncbi:hypothetical protein [Falsiroseomonas sp. E2-1-a20]|uniref:hypothetical protein n=1 Tax=Falsiroseomonas sp. E2-1-a20 TaxID=3239300 RepID=UPI003F2D6A3D
MLSATLPASGPALPRGAAPPAPRPALNPPPAPSTQLRIEASLQLVVLEFREPDGEMRQSIPTPREIDAYRNPPLPAPPSDLDLSR